MRGIPVSNPEINRGGGISPAHAGNTSENIFRYGTVVDQPRTCGEYQGPGERAPIPSGSAPHMRGIPARWPAATMLRGISPAHAGNTASKHGRCRCPRDQPRTCGEYLASVDRVPPTFGSAPHMRGIRGRPGRGLTGRGISPAHAGNTSQTRLLGGVPTDQPRTCGEYHPVAEVLGQQCGSAPHMRGIPPLSASALQRRWISPAHAGNTGSVASAWLWRPDQPRTCGEYGVVPGGQCTECGSAPHMRGIRPLRDYPATGIWISPAHAGNTSRRSDGRCGVRDQPRTCGEYKPAVGRPSQQHGSAPHMRGIRR